MQKVRIQNGVRKCAYGGDKIFLMLQQTNTITKLLVFEGLLRNIHFINYRQSIL